MFKELKKTTFEALNRTMMTMTHQIANINNEVSDIKNNHIEIL